MNEYHVEMLTGGYGDGPGERPPDYHVCDERGRTVRVFQRGLDVDRRHVRRADDWRNARRLAQDYADVLTAAGARTVQRRNGHTVIVGSPARSSLPTGQTRGDPVRSPLCLA